jgi:lipopolysaccharide export system protein LptA
MRKLYFLVLLCLMIALKSRCQVPNSKIEVLSADLFEYEQTQKGKVRKLLGNVKLKQDNTLLACDSAYQYEEINYVECYGNVHINTNDTVNINGDKLEYDGKEKKAKVINNVRMNDSHMTLTTSELNYDLANRQAFYQKGGKIVNAGSTLTSNVGYYYSRDKLFYFRKNVILITEKYIIKSDTLKQDTRVNITYFLGPTDITSKADSIYCENGWYNNEKNIAMFNKRVRLSSKERLLFADSLLFYRETDYGKAFNNIVLIDKKNAVELRGNFGEFFGNRKQSYITQKCSAKKLLTNDSMFVFADTIFSFQRDSIAKQQQLVKAFRKVRVVKTDMQSICDSMVYDYTDSTIKQYYAPIIWSGANQITSDTVLLFVNNNQLDSMYLLNNAFMISREAKQHFNQVKGKNMRGYLKDKEVEFLRVLGNCQSIFYAKDEKDSSFIGVNIVNCSEMLFTFDKNKIIKTNFINEPDAIFYPLNELKPEELKLKGFIWHEGKRPILKKLLKEMKMN